jgi:hypothetical protein
MSSLSREAILTVLSGLTLLSCDKASTPSAEPLASVSKAASAVSAAAGGGVSAQEVAPAQAADAKKPAGAASARAGGAVEKSCAPGGCAAGQCGAKK